MYPSLFFLSLSVFFNKVLQFLIILASLGLVSGAEASSQEDILAKANTLDLAHHTTWLKLLHYEKGSSHSSVMTEEFFVSLQGRNDPQVELEATIRAYFMPWGKDPNQSPRCRFPARYFWLSKQLSLPDYQLKDDRCINFEKWSLSDQVKSISVMLVSGYFGNPASTFGHAFLKFNTDSLDDQRGLFDLTLSYGAM
ncbi:MAG: DUF4105 domain-containing protein, partial [Candidatus Omnitrophica bacterium]|nr:DUF4105 domain-containing protein [Candidatus Omnitrophota bacterium]